VYIRIGFLLIHLEASKAYPNAAQQVVTTKCGRVAAEGVNIHGSISGYNRVTTREYLIVVKKRCVCLMREV
jgi:hypothetical protein